MNRPFGSLIITTLCCAGSLCGQERAPAGSPKPSVKATGDYAADVAVVLDAQGQALEQARTALEAGESARDRSALQNAIKEMERAQAALQQARKSTDNLGAALAAEQSAYQALLKATPREYRLSRSRSRSQSASSSAGQPSQEELNQLEMTGEENRYETERQASATPTQQQREQTQTVDRLKQLARRQQDLNDRLRDLQTALKEAPTQKEREEIQRQLKRLRDEERQLLSDVDELRQNLERSPEAAKQADARQQLDQTRSDVQKAAQDLERQSVSEALASGSRAEQRLQNLRENLRQQTSSQFAEQMRQMRSQARELASRQTEIARGLDEMNNSAQKPLDDAAQRRTIAEQLTRQQSSLTNLLGQMRAVTEQAESTEPLLSKQLYDILRRADQAHTGNQLELGERRVDRGFLPQASQAERAARQSIDELRQSVEHAAESVLGSEAEALRYAQKELDDLARQLANEMSTGTNSGAASAAQGAHGEGGTNSLAAMGGRTSNQASNGRGGTNAMANSASAAGRNRGTNDPSGASRQAENARGNRGEASAQANPGADQPPGEETARRGSTSRPGQEVAQAGGQGDPTAGEPDSQRRSPNSERQAASKAGKDQGKGLGKAQGKSGQAQQPGSDQPGQNPGTAESGGAGSDRDQLRQFAQQLGGGRGGLGLNGPITGNSFVEWSDRLRDVEQAVDSQDVRNQLATVRERVGGYRRDFRQDGRTPPKEELQTKVLAPLTLARNWVGQELSRAQNDGSLVPLDRDPVQDKYADLVRQYYEKLGSAR